MKIGVKTYKDEKFLKHFENQADFFEVQAIQKNNYNFLKKFSKPIVIHAEHFKQGSNPADKTMLKQNLKSINFAIKLADKTNAKKIILHSGAIINKNCSKQQSLNFIKKIKDKRIIIENLYMNNSITINPENVKEFLKNTKVGFCFDVSHAIASANIQNLNPHILIQDFLKLKPSHFHIGGQKMNSKIDNHCSFSNPKSDIPLKKILSLYPKNAEITLETTTDIKKTQYDLEFIREIIKRIN